MSLCLRAVLSGACVVLACSTAFAAEPKPKSGLAKAADATQETAKKTQDGVKRGLQRANRGAERGVKAASRGVNKAKKKMRLPEGPAAAAKEP